MKKHLLSFLAVLLISVAGYATHIVGGTLTYVYNGGSSYTFTLKLYRDCTVGTAAFPNNVTIAVRGYNGATFPTSKDFIMPLGTVTPIPSNLDTCAVPPTPMPCVQEGIYTLTVNNLPPNPGGYHCYYDVCCRNLSTTNVNATCNCIGSSMYTYIPGPTVAWLEDFTLANGTTVDAGTTAWTRTLGTPAPASAQVQGNLFEVQGANNAQAVWSSQVINISSFATGVNLSVNLAENGTLEAADSIVTYYSLNSGLPVPFAVNGIITNDFTNAVATSGPLVGSTIQIFVRVHYDANSPNTEIYRWDNVTVAGNDFLPNSTPVFNVFPPLFLCQGNLFSFNHAATDPDGDSLAYSFYTPYTDAVPTYASNVASFTPVTWLGGFSATNPLGGPPLTLNPTTGILSGTPTMTGQFIVGVKVREYRNSVLLSEMTRDFQFNITFCPAPAQALIVSGDTINACSGLNVTFPNNSDPQANNFTWNFGNPASTTDTSTIEFPSYSYPAPGTYLATLIINAGTACADTSYASVDVGFANAVFTTNAPQCALVPVTFTNSSTCSANTTISGYSWNFGDSQTSTAASPTHAYATGGTYTVTLITYTTLGCTDTMTMPITISPIPATPAPTSNSPICAGSTLNLSTAAVVGATYSWTGPNGFTSALQNPTIPAATVAAAGTYSVTVTLAGCASAAGTVTVTINPAPAPPVASSNSPLCAGSTLNLTASNIVGATYSWTGPNSFNSALQNPTIGAATIAASGTYSVTATVAGCPSAIATTLVTVNPVPATPTATSNSPVCQGSTINLSTPAVVGATYSWTGPGGFTSPLQNPTRPGATLPMAGTYSVTVTVGGCTSAAGTVAVVVNPTPATPAPTSNSPVCVGSTITLNTAAVVGATYSWTGPAAFVSALQNPTRPAATLAMNGTYSVTVTVGGCTSVAGTVAVTVNPTPAAPTASSNSAICAGSTLNLSASNIVGATYSWTGPNGFTSSLQNPTIGSATIAASGTYSVTATVGGCTSTFGTTVVTVNPIPATPAPGSNSPVCAGNTITLTTAAVVGATYSWTGPLGFTSALQNPTRPAATVGMAGTYSVTVTVNGCTSTAGTVNVIVNPTPAAPTASSNSPVCAGSTLNLSASNIVGATYSWTGPNGFTSALQNPTIVGVTIAASGTYSVTATVAGCPSVFGTTTVVVNPAPATPTASSNSPICVGQTLNLTTPAVVGATYAWTGPNSFSSALQNPTIPAATAAATGTYSLTITVNGCTSPVQTVVVNVNTPAAPPTLSSNSPVCSGNPLNLTSTAVIGATYSWTGPNGFTSTLQNPTIPVTTVAATGTYTLVVNNGCSSSPVTIVVVVNPTPVAPAVSSNSPICDGSTLNLTASNIVGATYSWTGPNGFTSSSQNPSIPGATSVNAGTYSVTVTVNGCTSTAATTNAVINPIPAVPSPTSNSPVCVGDTLTLSTPFVVGGTYSWNGPNGFTSTLQNPFINGVTLPASGTYSVTVSVSGCSGASGTVSVVVNPTPTTPVATSNSPICDGSTLNLNASNIVGATYNWTGPNSFTDSNQNTSITGATVAASGTYSVTATVNGCVSLSGTTTVVVNPIPATPSPTSNSPICIGQTLSFNTTAVVGATYSWTGPNGFTSALQNPSIPGATAAASGTYSLTVTVNGCTSATSTIVVLVSSNPPSPVVTATTPICAGQTLQLTADTIVGATYSWTGPNGFTSNVQNPSIPSSTIAASGTYTVVVFNGCASAPATVTVVVNPTPAPPVLGSNSPVCQGSTLNLTANFTASVTYSWNGPNSFSSSNQNPSIPLVTGAASGTYTCVTTLNGCTSPTATITIVVDTPSVVSAGSSQTVCANNAVVTLSGSSSTGSGVWSTSGTGTFSPSNNVLNPTYTPSNADTAAGSVTLTLTSTNNVACAATNNQITITFTDAPTADAGSPQTLCANNANVSLNGIITIAGGGDWTTSGTGSFSPSSSTLNATYIPSTADTAAGSVTLYLTTTLNGTCIAAVDSVVITFTDAPTVDAGPTVFRCSNNPNGQVNGSSSTGSGIWSTSGTGSFTPNNTVMNPTYIPTVTDISSGSVLLTLTSTSNGNCNAVTDTVSIIYTAPPTVVAGPAITVCANTGPIPLSGSSTTGLGVWTTSGTGTFAPNGLNGNYVPSAADTAAGTVTLTLTSTNNGGCIAVTDQLIITITDAPVALAGADITVCGNNNLVTLNGSVAIATGGIWSTSGTGTFAPSTTSLNATYNPTSADTAAGSIVIYLTTTGNGTCLATIDSLLVTFTDAPYVIAGDTILTCISSPNTVLSGYSSTGSGTWNTLGSGSFSPNNTTLNATYIPSTADTLAGSVMLVLTSGNNGTCNPEDDTVLIIFTTVPVVTISPDQTVCANNAVVSVSSSSTTGTGIWTTSGSGTFTPSASSLNPTYTPSSADTAAGSVTLTFTSTNGCIPVAMSLIITITDAPFVNAGPDLSVCANSPNATINAVIGGATTTGIWTTSGGGTFSPSNTDLNPTYIPDSGDITAGTVTLVLTSTGNGLCLAEADTVTLTITPPPVVTAGPDMVACANNAVALSGTITGGNGTVIWTTPNGSGSFTPADTALNASYVPSNADTLISPVMIIVTSTNNGGCLASSDTLFINVNPGPEVTAGPDQTVCANAATVVLSGTVYLATGVQWSTNGDGVFSPDSISLNVNYTPGVIDTANGTVTLYITSTGNGLCNAATDSMVVTITPAPFVDAGPNQAICSGNMNVQLNGSITGGASSGVWTTNGTGVFTPNDSTLNAIYTMSTADTINGTVWLYLSSTNNGLCLQEVDSMQISITPIPLALAGNDTTLCADGSGITLNGIVLGGSGTGVWSTSGDGTFSPSDSVLNATYTPGPLDTANATVTLILNATNACVPEADTVVITIVPAPTVVAGNNALICAGETVALGGSVTNTTGGTWQTTGDGTFSPSNTVLNPTYTPGPNDITSGTTTLVLTADSTGFCSSVQDSMVITINSKPEALFYFSGNCELAATAFADSSTNVNGAIVSWSWLFDTDTSSLQDPSHTFATTGTHIVTLVVMTAAGCADTLVQTLYVNATPVASYDDTITCPADVVLSDSSFIAQGTIATWSWDLGDSTFSALQNPTHTYADTGSYIVTLTVTSDSGCVSTFSDTLIFVPCSDDVQPPILPGAFTPNGDGHNDVLFVLGGPFLDMHLEVYNEWGNLIFASDSQSIGWDGYYKGKPQPAGTYVWVLTGTTADNMPVNSHGTVTILR